jgi:hypothetical protein
VQDDSSLDEEEEDGRIDTKRAAALLFEVEDDEVVDTHR